MYKEECSTKYTTSYRFNVRCKALSLSCSPLVVLDRNAQNCHAAIPPSLNLPLHFPATWSRFVPTTIQIFTEMWSRFVGEAIQIFQVEIPDFLWRHSLDYRRAQRVPSWIFWNFPIMYFSIFQKAFLYFRWRASVNPRSVWFKVGPTEAFDAGSGGFVLHLHKTN